MSNLNLKAKNKNTGEIVEFNKYDDYEKGKGYLYQEPSGLHFNRNSIYNEQEFNELYEVVEDKGQGVSDMLYRPNYQPVEDPNHPYGGMEVLDNVPVETWEDNGSFTFDELKNIIDICNVKDVKIKQDYLTINFVPKNAIGNQWRELKEKMLRITERK